MKHPVFLCVGTPRIVGDSLGPRVGDILRDRNVSAYVYGTWNHPVTSLNVKEYAAMLKRRHADSVVVVVDAALGAFADVGRIKLNENGIKPGGAFHEERERIGDVGVMVIVGESGGDRMTELKTRDEDFIDKLAAKTADLLVSAVF